MSQVCIMEYHEFLKKEILSHTVTRKNLTKGQRLQDSTQDEIAKVAKNHRNRKQKGGCYGLGGRERELMFNWQRVSVLQDGKFQRFVAKQ